MASVTPFYAEEEEPPVTPDIQTTPAANTEEEPLVTPPPISPYVPRGPYAWAKDVTLSSPPPLPAQESVRIRLRVNAKKDWKTIDVSTSE